MIQVADDVRIRGVPIPPHERFRIADALAGLPQRGKRYLS